MPDFGRIARNGARKMFRMANAETGVYSQKQGGTYVQLTDTWTGQSTVNYTVRAIQATERVENIKGNTVVIELVPKVIILAESVPANFSPTADDTIVLGGVTFVVVSINVAKVGPTIVAYVMTLKN